MNALEASAQVEAMLPQVELVTSPLTAIALLLLLVAFGLAVSTILHHRRKEGELIERGKKMTKAEHLQRYKERLADNLAAMVDGMVERKEITPSGARKLYRKLGMAAGLDKQFRVRRYAPEQKIDFDALAQVPAWKRMAYPFRYFLYQKVAIPGEQPKQTVEKNPPTVPRMWEPIAKS